MSSKAWQANACAGAGARRPTRSKRRIAARNAARKAKDFTESDRIRDELAAHGRRAEGLQGRHHLGGRAMMARAHPTVRAAAVSCRQDTPMLAEIFRASIEELTGGRLQPGAAGGLGVARPTTWRRSPRGSAST